MTTEMLILYFLRIRPESTIFNIRTQCHGRYTARAIRAYYIIVYTLPLAVVEGDLATCWAAWEKCVRHKSSGKTYISLGWFPAH